MGAVVDAHPGRRIVIGAATAAGLVGRLMDDRRDAATGEPNGRCQSGKAGADDMNRAVHQMKA